MMSLLHSLGRLPTKLIHVPLRNATSAAGQAVLNTRQKINVGSSYMSYLDTGTTSPPGKTVVFLHGNPTQAYLWRNIIPHVEGVARCLAPDLIGQGDSGKEPTNQYHFFDHYKYLCEWIDKMELDDKLNLVIHDWGSGLGFHWANQHRDRVESITFMEAFVRPMPSWEEWPEFIRGTFKDLRTEKGEQMVLKENMFVEQLFPLSIQREMSKEEMEVYIRPFKQPGEDRRPTLTWPRLIPVRGVGPPEMMEVMDNYNAWLSKTELLPKLHIESQPGFLAPFINEATKDWPNLSTAQAKGLHFLQEDSPDEIGQATAKFLKTKVFN